MINPISDPVPPEDKSYQDARQHSGPKLSPAAVKKIDAKVREMERDRNDLATVLQTEQGQAFVMRLFDQCGLYASTFSASHAAASFNDGRREIGRWLLGEVHSIDPELYANLILSHVHRQKRLESIDAGIAQVH